MTATEQLRQYLESQIKKADVEIIEAKAHVAAFHEVLSVLKQFEMDLASGVKKVGL